MKTFRNYFSTYFIWPTLVTFFCLILVFYFGTFSALLSVVILIILEITLSFDNAIVNAGVLEKLNLQWQKRFVNWGIWIAVIGTRIILPILIVTFTSGLSASNVLNLAIFYPKIYSEKLQAAHYVIGAFGGIFLLLVALKYFIDDEKKVHWIGIIEKKLKKFSSIKFIEVILAGIILCLLSYLVTSNNLQILVAGIIGIVSFLLMQAVTDKVETGVKGIAKTGFALFMYLNLLDVAFSLDGVIGAFAISTNIIVIAIGLGIGAYFVRSFTVLLVHEKALKELKYLDHGAHWAIFALAICMLTGLIFPIPEFVTGTIGLIFVFSSFVSSKL